jgi:hypothetical protein
LVEDNDRLTRKDGLKPMRQKQRSRPALRSYGEAAGVQGDGGMVIATPGVSLLKSTFGLAALMAVTGRPYIRAMVAALSPELRT